MTSVVQTELVSQVLESNHVSINRCCLKGLRLRVQKVWRSGRTPCSIARCLSRQTVDSSSLNSRQHSMPATGTSPRKNDSRHTCRHAEICGVSRPFLQGFDTLGWISLHDAV